MWHPEHLYGRDGHLDEGVIHAWLDGGLDRDAAREVEAHASACTTCSVRVEEARGFVAGASRILESLDDAPRVTPPIAPRVTPPVEAGSRRAWWGTRRWSLAAAAVFVLAAGSLVMRDRLGGSDGVREAIIAERQARAVEAPSAAPETSSAAAEGATMITTPAPFAAGRGNTGSGLADGEAARAVTSSRPANDAGTGRRQAAAVAPATTPSRAPVTGRAGAVEMPVAGVAAKARTADEPVRSEGAIAAAAPSGSGAGGAAAAPSGSGASVAAAAPPPSAAPSSSTAAPVPAPSPSAAAVWNKAPVPEPARRQVTAQQARVSAESPVTDTGDSAETECWRIDGSMIVLRRTGASAPEGDAWRLGERTTGDRTVPLRWREEIGTAGRRFRLADPDSLDGDGLLLLVRGDSLFQMPAGPEHPAGPLRGVRVECRN